MQKLKHFLVNSCAKETKRIDFFFSENCLHNPHIKIRETRLHFIRILIYVLHIHNRNTINIPTKKKLKINYVHVFHRRCHHVGKRRSTVKMNGLRVVSGFYTVTVDDAFIWNRSSLSWLLKWSRFLYAKSVPIHLVFGIYSCRYLFGEVLWIYLPEW